MIIIPIEILEERYSKQWYESIKKDFPDARFIGDLSEKKINNGEFLDCIYTNKYKAMQMVEIISMIEKGEIDTEETFWFLDGWFPGIQYLSYIKDTMGYNFKFKCLLHAGTWDKNDFLTKKGLSNWGYGFEHSFMNIYDEIIVATEYHKKLITNYFSDFGYNKIKVKPFPIFTIEPTIYTKKEDIVVFPHRLADEKQPHLFDLLKNTYHKKYNDSVSFIKSKEFCETKEDYYNLLSRSKIAVSFALQETFGIAMLEANNLGCHCFVKNDLSYSELFKSDNFYRNIDNLADRIHLKLQNSHKYPNPYMINNFKHIL